MVPGSLEIWLPFLVSPGNPRENFRCFAGWPSHKGPMVHSVILVLVFIWFIFPGSQWWLGACVDWTRVCLTKGHLYLHDFLLMFIEKGAQTQQSCDIPSLNPPEHPNNKPHQPTPTPPLPTPTPPPPHPCNPCRSQRSSSWIGAWTSPWTCRAAARRSRAWPAPWPGAARGPEVWVGCACRRPPWLAGPGGILLFLLWIGEGFVLLENVAWFAETKRPHLVALF